SNLLAKYLDSEKGYKSILAKPIKTENYQIEWHSMHQNLKDVREHEALKDRAYRSYYEFLELINSKIQSLRNNPDQDSQNWAGILSSIFKEEDNLVFSNGQDISIIWGWKFGNNTIYRPSIEKSVEISTPVQEQPPIVPQVNPEPVTLPPLPEDAGTPNEVEPEIEENEFIIIDLEKEPIEEEPKKESFLDYLQWFAANYWWILVLLVFLTALVFTFKAFKFS